MLISFFLQIQIYIILFLRVKSSENIAFIKINFNQLTCPDTDVVDSKTTKRKQETYRIIFIQALVLIFLLLEYI